MMYAKVTFLLLSVRLASSKSTMNLGELSSINAAVLKAAPLGGPHFLVAIYRNGRFAQWTMATFYYITSKGFRALVSVPGPFLKRCGIVSVKDVHIVVGNRRFATPMQILVHRNDGNVSSNLAVLLLSPGSFPKPSPVSKSHTFTLNSTTTCYTVIQRIKQTPDPVVMFEQTAVENVVEDNRISRLRNDRGFCSTFQPSTNTTVDECPTCLRSSKKLPKNFCPRDIGYQVAHDEIFLKLIISEQVAFSAIPIEVEKSQDIYFLTSAAAILEVPLRSLPLTLQKITKGEPEKADVGIFAIHKKYSKNSRENNMAVGKILFSFHPYFRTRLACLGSTISGENLYTCDANEVENIHVETHRQVSCSSTLDADDATCTMMSGCLNSSSRAEGPVVQLKTYRYSHTYKHTVVGWMDRRHDTPLPKTVMTTCLRSCFHFYKCSTENCGQRRFTPISKSIDWINKAVEFLKDKSDKGYYRV